MKKTSMHENKDNMPKACAPQRKRKIKEEA